jgi:hypothetical protein
MTSKRDVLARQVQWAGLNGLTPDAKGYLAGYEVNLFRPLSAPAISCFQSASGNELLGSSSRPAKMSALHSSSALAVNVFDYWSEQPDVVLAALELPTGAVSMKFEAQFPTGLDGNPPNLDVAIRWADGTWLGIESKFTEWLTPKAPGKELFRSKYFPDAGALWRDRGLAKCQELAADLNSGRVAYRYLDAPQLLKHALGLAASAHPFALLYIYYDVPGTAGYAHRAEAEGFAEHIAGDFPFHIRRYQAVFQRLAAIARPADQAYIEYLAARYFPEASLTTRS